MVSKNPEEQKTEIGKTPYEGTRVYRIRRGFRRVTEFGHSDVKRRTQDRNDTTPF